MFKTKISLLLIAICLLNLDFLLSYPALAEQIHDKQINDSSIIVSHINSQGVFSRASNPNCSIFETTAVIGGVIALISTVAIGLAIVLVSVASSVTTLFLSNIGAAVAIAAMIAGIYLLWKSVGPWVVCTHSFVAHPVAHDSKGNFQDFALNDAKYSECTDKNYATEDEYFKCLEDKNNQNGERKNGQNIAKEILSTTQEILSTTQDSDDHYRWPKNNVRYSEYIRVCHRNPLSFSHLIRSNPGLEDKSFNPREKAINNARKNDTLIRNITESPWKYVDGDLDCRSIKAGQTAEIHGSVFKAVHKASKLCVVLDSVRLTGSVYPRGVNIGCVSASPAHIAPMCSASKIKFKDKDGNQRIFGLDEHQGNYQAMIKLKEEEGLVFDGYDNDGCFSSLSKACYDRSKSNSFAPVPITSMIVECIHETLGDLVKGDRVRQRDTFLSIAQKRLKNAVTAALVLALMLFALKVMSGGVRSHQEIYVLILKFALVVYFTTGDTMSEYYGYLMRISNHLQDVVLSASSQSDNNICNYPVEKYATEHAYLASWDKLDCRILFYWGAPLKGSIAKGGTLAAFALLGSASTLLIAGSVVGILLVGGGILIAIAAIFMALLLMMVILWMCYIYILSLIALTVVVIISPLFIPMILFQVTKGYFDSWVKELITYSLYPVIMFSFLSFMFVACDKVFFKDLKFAAKEVKVEGSGRTQIWFELAREDACSAYGKTQDKHGTQVRDEDYVEKPLACLLQEFEFKTHTLLGLITFIIPYFGEFNTYIAKELMKLGLILFLFYHFLSALPGMAAELAGNYRAQLGQGGTPASMVNTAIKWGKAAASGGMEAASALGSAMGKSLNDQTPNAGGSETIRQNNTPE
ncbi:hypothetical protein BIY23_01075 [Wolbachia pipientis]|uniref:Conjugal transfer protein TraH n=1 Tax=Wolbachia pipientis TaxID=955 RepID=A0A1E7QKR0_WOLPI|nr:type IV secretion system protein [Wolbachia pipientis]OEY87065.1 hypothetical protein BIY23_01075 [Wolbachia pipientis]